MSSNGDPAATPAPEDGMDEETAKMLLYIFAGLSVLFGFILFVMCSWWCCCRNKVYWGGGPGGVYPKKTAPPPAKKTKGKKEPKPKKEKAASPKKQKSPDKKKGQPLQAQGDGLYVADPAATGGRDPEKGLGSDSGWSSAPGYGSPGDYSGGRSVQV